MIKRDVIRRKNSSRVAFSKKSVLSRQFFQKTFLRLRQNKRSRRGIIVIVVVVVTVVVVILVIVIVVVIVAVVVVAVVVSDVDQPTFFK